MGPIVNSELGGPLKEELLIAAGSVHASCTGSATDSKEPAVGGNSILASSSSAANLASSKDSEGRLHLATVVACLSEGRPALTEAAWQTVWDLLATQGECRTMISIIHFTTP